MNKRNILFTVMEERKHKKSTVLKERGFLATFLKKHGAYASFRGNLAKNLTRYSAVTNDDVDIFCCNENYYGIGNSFFWEETKEGCHYWSRLLNEYIHYREKHYNG